MLGKLNTTALSRYNLMSKISLSPSDLTSEEFEISLKALGYYQVHLFDELSKENSNREALEIEMKTATKAIKKIHGILEGMKKKV